MKNYLIESNDLVTINTHIDNILNENNLSKENIIKYDLSESLLENVIEDLNTYGFLINNKVIICSNLLFLSSDKGKYPIEQKEVLLEKYLLNPNLDNILILIGSDLDGRKKIVKLIKEKCIVYNDKINIENIIKEKLEDYEMNYITINYLINVCSNDNERILTELNKLKLYKLEDKKITTEDIDKIVIKSLEDNVFDLINSAVKKDIYRALNIYHKLLEKGEDTNKLVIMVADQFRLIFSSKVLSSNGETKDQIAKILDVHEYRIKLAMESMHGFNEDELLYILNELGNIDIKSKTKNISNKLEFETFLYNMGGNYVKN